ncbi:MAG: NAD-dependent deacylase [Blastocatellia bacterium]|nr:NAD-dependent deacylase [Blastocatellia bacterium]
MIDRIDIAKYSNIVVLTGAGISVPSGLKPFRGPGGLWNDIDILKYATVEALQRDPAGVWNFANYLREQVNLVKPNKAHFALAELENSLPSHKEFTLITQNVDELHQKAGNRKVVEYHGSINKTKCSNKKCHLQPYKDTHSSNEMPRCSLCSSPLRHDIILFGEDIPSDAQLRSSSALRKSDLFIAIGTSGTVYPAADFVTIARRLGATTILVNLEDIEEGGTMFQQVYLGNAEEILPELFGV